MSRCRPTILVERREKPPPPMHMHKRKVSPDGRDGVLRGRSPMYSMHPQWLPVPVPVHASASPCMPVPVPDQDEMGWEPLQRRRGSARLRQSNRSLVTRMLLQSSFQRQRSSTTETEGRRRPIRVPVHYLLQPWRVSTCSMYRTGSLDVLSGTKFKVPCTRREKKQRHSRMRRNHQERCQDGRPLDLHV